MARHRRIDEGGYAMVALLVGIAIMAVVLSVALPSWTTMAKREREEELVFRGEQYARAIQLYQRKFANAFPPTLDLLVEQRFLRKKYKDPITGDDFTPVAVGDPILQTALGGRGAGTALPGRAAGSTGLPGGGGAGQPQRSGLGAQGLRVGGVAGAGLIGVVSKSDAQSLRLYNGRDKYNEWVFVAQQATTAAGAPGGAQRPGGPGQARPGGVPGRGTQQPGRGLPAGGFPARGGGRF